MAYDNAFMTAGEYWDYQLIQNYIYPRATYGEEPCASMLATPPGELVHMFKKDEIEVVVVGGDNEWLLAHLRGELRRNGVG